MGFDEIAFRKSHIPFSVDGPGEDNILFRHRFSLPDLTEMDLGTELYSKAPWVISCNEAQFFFQGTSNHPDDPPLHRFAIFSSDFSRATIYSPPHDVERVTAGGWHSLSLFPTDQIWLAPMLADRDALLMHSSAAIVNGQGLVFIGHSEAGKSTTMELLRKRAQAVRNEGVEVEILCDDRNVLRKWDDGWRVHGTWSHGTTPDVSCNSAPLRAILFLKAGKDNRIIRMTDRRDTWKGLLATLVRSVVTADWWQRELDVLEQLVADSSFYHMHFDKSGDIVDELVALTG